jgi:ATP-dependent HslUV protease ATP-binding subunit HslU
VEFTDDAIARIAEIAWQVNERMENIGARRLHTVMERVMETISYEASDMSGQRVSVDAPYVNDHLDALLQDEDLRKYIL